MRPRAAFWLKHSGTAPSEPRLHDPDLNLRSGSPKVVTYDLFTQGSSTQTINLKDANAGFSSLVDEVVRGEFVTIMRHGKLVAALVSIEAVEIARKAMEPPRLGLLAYLRTFPGGEFECNRTPSRDVALSAGQGPYYKPMGLISA